MSNTIHQLADWAYHFLHDPAMGGQVAWIFVESREDGVDLARRMHKLEFGDFAGVEIPFDTIPTYAVGLEESKVFILAQPDHIETALVTMHRDGSGDFMARAALPGEQKFWGKVLAEEPDMKVWLQHAARQDQFQVRPPEFILMDQEAPNWDMLSGYVGRGTQLHLTDRVKTRPEAAAA